MAQVPQGPHGSSLRDAMECVTLRPSPRAETVASVGRCMRGGAGQAMDACRHGGQMGRGWTDGCQVNGWTDAWVGG